jgi:hypothetical protein
MATTTAPPSHVENFIKDANDMEWEVVRTTKSITVTPPAGLGKAGAKKITISLNPPPAPPQLRKQLVDSGFLAALATTQRLADEASAAKEDKPQTAATAEKKTDAKFVCPECQADHFTRPNTLGSHRRIVHGIIGSSQPVKKPAKRPVKKAAPAKKAGPAKTKEAIPAPRAAVDKAAPAVAGTEGLTEGVALAVRSLVDALATEGQGEKKALQDEVTELRDFKEKVRAEALNPNQAPIKALANIADLFTNTPANS